ncbi:MAG: hypothetical protein KTR30_22780 [Saprospiraceae bacterium]|nr:hypothetical protein [Saprospiraceae bacterium]
MKSYYLFLILFLLQACQTTHSLSNFNQQWQSLRIENQDFPIHRLAATRQALWAADYGSGTLYQSKNKGKTWHKMTTLGAEYLEVLQFVDTKYGFTCGDYGFVYRTSDGGVTWQEISPPMEGRIKERYRNDEEKDQQPEGLFVAYYNMHFLDAEEGFVSGFSYRPKEGFRESYQPLFFHTTDAGGNWTLVFPENQQDFLSAFILRAQPESESINGVYYQDTSWSIQLARDKDRKDITIRKKGPAAVPDTSYLPPHPFTRGMLRHILFLNTDEGYILGGSLDEGNQKAIVYKTVDKGKNWAYLPTDFPHIHGLVSQRNYLWISGKENMLKRRKLH